MLQKCMRILHVHKYFHERDGAGRYLIAVMRLLEAAGHSTAIFAMHTPENIPTPWDKYFVSALDTQTVGRGFGSVRQFVRALWSREAGRKLDAMITAFAPDVIHVHNIYTHLSPSVLAVAKRRGIPVVMTVHDYALLSANYALWDKDHPLPLGEQGLLATARTRFIKQSFLATFGLECIRRWHRVTGAYDNAIAHYVTPSNFVRQAVEMLGVAAARITVAYPPIAMPPAMPPEDKGYVLFVGRLEAYKGVATLIAAMRKHPKTMLRIVGEGPENTRLVALARGMKNVIFEGFLQGEALWKEYAGARALVVPSLWYEPFGLVTLEAMARGVPVIVSDRGGLPEIVEDGVSGLVFRAGDAKGLAHAIGQLAGDPVLAAAVGKAGKIRAKKLGDSARHLAVLEGVYTSVIQAQQ